MKTFRVFTVLSTMGLLMLFARGAAAHRPIGDTGEDTIRLPNITTSFVVYRNLQRADQIDRFAFHADGGEKLHVGINIPAIRGLETYGVSVAIVGPGLDGVDLELLPVAAPEGSGTMIIPSRVGDEFFEPFTQTSYWGRQQADIHIPQSGEYVILVWSPDGQAGKYVIDTGTQEVFGLDDLLRFPMWWLRVHHYFGHTPYLIALVISGIATFVVLAIRRHRAAR